MNSVCVCVCVDIYASSVFLVYKVCYALWGREGSLVTQSFLPEINLGQHKPRRLITMNSIWQFRICHKAIILCSSLKPFNTFQMHLDYTLTSLLSFIMVQRPSLLWFYALLYSQLSLCPYPLPTLASSQFWEQVECFPSSGLWSQCQCLLLRGVILNPPDPKP